MWQTKRLLSQQLASKEPEPVRYNEWGEPITIEDNAKMVMAMYDALPEPLKKRARETHDFTIEKDYAKNRAMATIKHDIEDA